MASFFVSLHIFFKYSIRGNLKLLFYYGFITFSLSCISICQNFSQSLTETFVAKVNYLSSVPHFFLLTVFILEIRYPVVKDRTTIIFSCTSFLLLTTAVSIDFFKRPMLIFAIANSGHFVLCCIYYYKLFANSSRGSVLSDSSFWVVTGMFFCMCLTLPLIAFHAFLNFKDLVDFPTFKNLDSIGAMGYVIMHVFFIKAYRVYLQNNKYKLAIIA